MANPRRGTRRGTFGIVFVTERKNFATGEICELAPARFTVFIVFFFLHGKRRDKLARKTELKIAPIVIFVYSRSLSLSLSFGIKGEHVKYRPEDARESEFSKINKKPFVCK